MLPNIQQRLNTQLRHLSMHSKILLGMSSVVLLGILVLIGFYLALNASGHALDRVTNEEEPISAAAYEMSINIANSGTTLLNFLRTGDVYYRDAAMQEKSDFMDLLNRYNSMANNDQEKTLAADLYQEYGLYSEMAEGLMDQQADHELSYAITQEQIELAEDVLDEAVAKLGVGSRFTDRRLLLQKLQVSLAQIKRDLAAYMRIGQIQPQARNSIENEIEKFIVELGYYRGLNLGRIETDRVSRIQKLFEQTNQSINQTLGIHDQVEAQLESYYLKRNQIDALVADEMLPVARADLALATSRAEVISSRAKTWSFILAPFALLLGWIVVYFIGRSVTEPVNQLVKGAHMLGSGDLNYRIQDVGDDELGALGQRFNQMAERLQKTTVSRDRLEKSEAEVRLSQERYERALSGTNDGIFDWDLVNDTVYFSPRMKTMLGYPTHCEYDKMEKYYSLVHEDDVELLRHNINAYINRPGEYLVNEHRILHGDGEYRWVLFRALASGRDDEKRATRLAGSQTDIDLQKQAEQQLIHDAMHDQLTGLPNRHLLLDRLQHFLDNSRRRETELCAMFFLDLDGFKFVNDSLGHAAGDQLLIALSHRLKKILKSTDTLARFGGDEFVILTEELSDDAQVEQLAEQIHSALDLPFETGQRKVEEGEEFNAEYDEMYPGDSERRKINKGQTYLGASIGVAISHHYTRAEDMLRDADIAMYRAKSRPDQDYVIFDQAMHGEAIERLALENELRIALEQNQFEVYYQPIIDLQDSRKLQGFEALLRWNHPERGLVEPNQFIPLLEQSGLIIDVGHWLIADACRTVKSWHQSNYTPWVSINVSAVQLRDTSLISSVVQALDESKLSPQYLTLEITESNVMKNEMLARDLLNRIKQMGIRLSMDDFGVGYSSLSYLKRFPWDYVKIDRSFVQDIEHDPEAASIIKSIIIMVHSLKFDVVAEGIETIQQLQVLQDYGIDCVQGYLLSPPHGKEAWDGLNSLSSKKYLKDAMQASVDLNQAKAKQ